MDLQSNAFPGGTLNKTGALTGCPNLSTRPLIRNRCGYRRCHHSTDEQTEHTN
jgi:hypothetical protein